jgi:hypothetical protein
MGGAQQMLRPARFFVPHPQNVRAAHTKSLCFAMFSAIIIVIVVIFA